MFLEILTGGKSIFSIIKDVVSFCKSHTKWTEKEINLTQEEIDAMVKDGVLPKDCILPREDRVQAYIFKGTHEVVYIKDNNKKIKTKITYGRYGDRCILMRKI